MIRALAIPPIAEVRTRLRPEWPVYASSVDAKCDTVTSGIADAVVEADDGSFDLVVDWKSDVAPSPETIEEYRKQVGAYLAATGARGGIIVFPASRNADPGFS